MDKDQQVKNDILEDNNNIHETTLSIRNSFHLKNQMNTVSMQQSKQKSDASTSTDQLICKCDCDQIQKLKQKAHKSFMQVIQIENLYKQEIEQIQQQYEEREKTQLKKFQCKQQMLNEKCKELEQELEKNRQYLEKEREDKKCKCQVLENHILEFSPETPFVIDNIEEIYPEIKDNPKSFNPDDSTDTIRYLKQYIPSENLQEQHKILEDNLKEFVEEFKSILNEVQQSSEVSLVFGRVQRSINEVMGLIKLLIQNAISSQQKYNSLYLTSVQTQNRYTKLMSVYESGQKQSKFMAQHIRRISQQKIKIDRKFHEVEKINKQLQENINILKKKLSQKGVSNDGIKKKESDIQSSVNFRDSNDDDDDISISLGSIGHLTSGPKRPSNPNPILMRMSNEHNKPNPLNFRKKPNLLQKKAGH